MQYVIVSDRLGIFLCVFLGLCFWSSDSKEAVGGCKKVANTFDQEDGVKMLTVLKESTVDLGTMRLVEVKTAELGIATSDECKAAGLEGW